MMGVVVLWSGLTRGAADALWGCPAFDLSAWSRHRLCTRPVGWAVTL